MSHKNRRSLKIAVGCTHLRTYICQPSSFCVDVREPDVKLVVFLDILYEKVSDSKELKVE